MKSRKRKPSKEEQAVDEYSVPLMDYSKKSGLRHGIKYELLMREALEGATEKEKKKKNHEEVDKLVVATLDVNRGNVGKLSFEAFRSFVKNSRGKRTLASE